MQIAVYRNPCVRFIEEGGGGVGSLSVSWPVIAYNCTLFINVSSLYAYKDLNFMLHGIAVSTGT